MKRVPFIFILSLLVGLLVVFWPRPAITNSGQASVQWLKADPGVAEADAFDRVYGPQPLAFPRDFGPHENYQTEWWYYTGNLATATGREFGYQLTFFRRGLTPGLDQAPDHSDWRTNQIYFSHFTMSDIANQAFYPHERFSRGAAALAGAQTEPYRVWLEDWSAEEGAPGDVHLTAQAEDVALDLHLTQTLPPVLQGDQGYSPKSDEPGNASYYYSIVQQQTAGTVRIGDETLAVTGTSWKDHEYSTSALSDGIEGWDWFSLQFDNGSAMMLYVLRDVNATGLKIADSKFVAADGSETPILTEDCQIAVTDTWQSPTSDAVYPSQWHIEIPKIDLVLDGQPLMPNQELNVSTTYWEGATAFTGRLASEPITAKGYVEMTGYNNTSMAGVL
ncbi:MAG: lipocalin-like domain-containing protein [Cyanobacteria bacterium P01_A01_bin.105]